MSEKTITQTKLLTVKKTADYLAVSERTVWTLIDNNRFPVVRFGKIVRIDRDDLDAFIQARKGA